MNTHRQASPHFTSLLKLAATFLLVIYMLLIGGSFDATIRFRVQLLNAIGATIIALLWLASRLRQRARLIAIGLEWSLLALALSQFVAAAASAQPRLSLEAAVSATAWISAFIITCDLMIFSQQRDYVLNALIVAAAIITTQALWEVAGWFLLWARLEQAPPAAFRVNGFLGHANLTAAALNLLLPLVIVRALNAKSLAERLALTVLALSMLVAEFYSSSRAGWIAGAAALGLMAALVGWASRERVAGWAALWQRQSWVARASLIALGVGGLIAGGWLLARQSQHATHSALFASRQIFWQPAWQLFLASPLTGAGPDLYPWFYPRATSIPPGEVVPHAHSLVFQLLSGSGLLGFGAALSVAIVGSFKLWRRWQNDSDKVMTAALISSLAGIGVHSLFDYFFGSPAFVFLLIMIGALAFAPPPSPRHEKAGIRAAWLALPLTFIVGFTIFSLRGAALNDRGLQLATQNKWDEAARVFQQAATVDPGFTLYWEHAAQALTRAGETEAAIPLWKRVAHDDPYWSLWPVTLAVLTNEPASMDSALRLAPDSYLVTLNAGALAESTGDAATATRHYQQTLTLNPLLAGALFWAQTPLREEALAEWQAAQPVDTTSLAQGWAALEAGDAERAVKLFEHARAESALSNQPYLGLSRAYWALGDEKQAELFLHTGQNLPVYTIYETLGFKLLEGDWQAAHGDRAGAKRAYTELFSAFNEYTLAGPGTYGYPWRSWVVYHRNALPSDLIPQLVRADITAEIDARLAQVAQWHIEDDERDIGCYILERVRREAPISASGKLRETLCQ